MAPARMVQFIKQHVSSCAVCSEDPNLQEEIDKITDIILPESKIPKAVRLKQELDDEDDADYEEETEEKTTDSEEESEEDSDLEDEFSEDEEDPLTTEEDDF